MSLASRLALREEISSELISVAGASNCDNVG